jgi:hypothetical protein
MEELEQFFEGLKEDLDEMQMGIEEERQAASKWRADYASSKQRRRSRHGGWYRCRRRRC